MISYCLIGDGRKKGGNLVKKSAKLGNLFYNKKGASLGKQSARLDKKGARLGNKFINKKRCEIAQTRTFLAQSRTFFY